MSARHAQQYRSWIRSQARAASHLPIAVVDGPSAPQELGERGYWTTPSGRTIVRHPNAYGYPTLYHCSTRRVEVGRDWLAARCIPAEVVA
jgi:hypothetical protein